MLLSRYFTDSLRAETPLVRELAADNLKIMTENHEKTTI
jgi:hypothetical protein